MILAKIMTYLILIVGSSVFIPAIFFFHHALSTGYTILSQISIFFGLILTLISFGSAVTMYKLAKKRIDITFKDSIIDIMLKILNLKE